MNSVNWKKEIEKLTPEQLALLKRAVPSASHALKMIRSNISSLDKRKALRARHAVEELLLDDILHYSRVDWPSPLDGLPSFDLADDLDSVIEKTDRHQAVISEIETILKEC